jgi:hypothetical protein
MILRAIRLRPESIAQARSVQSIARGAKVTKVVILVAEFANSTQK